MLQNYSQHFIQDSENKEKLLLTQAKKQEQKILLENIISNSQHNSNLSEDKSQKGLDKTIDDSTAKEMIFDDICLPVIKIKDCVQEEPKSQNAQTHNRKSEITINQKKVVPQQKKVNFEKCWNKLCSSKGIKKTKSRVDGRYFCLCNSCFKNYNLKQYCQYCEQIYAQQAVDGLEWIQCDVEGCGRWNHTTCQKANFEFDNLTRYFCKKCRAYPHIQKQFGQRSQSGLSQKAYQNNKYAKFQQRMKIFRNNGERFGYLQSMLTSFSYKLSLPEQHLRQQMLCLTGQQFFSQSDSHVDQRGNKKRQYR